jgi:hypothetical protein
MKIIKTGELIALGMALLYISANAIPISVNYSASGYALGSVSQTATINSGQQDFISLGPDGQPLFDVNFGTSLITITALRSLQEPGSSTYFQFNWDFGLSPSGGIYFGNASLLSSTLFSVPPFTFPVYPNVSLNSANQDLGVSLFLTGGGNGFPTVNGGGAAVITYSAVPDICPTGVLLAVSMILLIILRFVVKQPNQSLPLALAVPQFTPRVGGGSACYSSGEQLTTKAQNIK